MQETILNFIKNHIIFYPVPALLTWLWSYGFLIGMFLFIQILTGLFLSMFYIPSLENAFVSIQTIMFDLHNGWFLRYSHCNSASFCFFFLYIHLFRGIYFKLYKNQSVWYTGFILFLLMIITAFLGYILPWGQMSYWAVTVITTLVSILPLLGADLLYWLWGDFIVSKSTLIRFYSLHFLLPFIICALIILHLCALHIKGSHDSKTAFPWQFLTFLIYYMPKDLTIFAFYLFTLYVFIIYKSELLNHPDNNIQANILVTPQHILPEWYFLPFYAILRAFLDKVTGFQAILVTLGLLLTIPALHNQLTQDQRNESYFVVLYKNNVFSLTAIFWLLLFWLGVLEPTSYHSNISFLLTINFIVFLILYII